ncbi:MAG TPA: head GIN domain-containing protein [Chitinophagaceae bacterium]|nr:head GIN domain-containing protein [Chitinophagaceae bacterium]
MIRFFALALFSSLILTSCHFGHNDRIRGNGTIKTEKRSTGSFSKVDVGGNIEVYIKQDSVYSVRIETDENLLEYIIVRTDGDQLVIEPKDHSNLSGTNDIKVYVSAPVFKKLEVSGASSISTEGLVSSEEIDIEISGASSANLELKSPRVSAEINGASNVLLKGQTKDLKIEGGGASHARCFDLLSENANVDVSGASSAEVFASVSLKADASGASHIKYKGAATHTGTASGAGSISKVE